MLLTISCHENKTNVSSKQTLEREKKITKNSIKEKSENDSTEIKLPSRKKSKISLKNTINKKSKIETELEKLKEVTKRIIERNSGIPSVKLDLSLIHI